MKEKYQRLPLLCQRIILLVGFLLVAFLIISIVLHIIYCFNSTAQIEFTGTVDQINSLDATGIIGCFADTFESSATRFRFDGIISMESLTRLEIKKNNQWVETDVIYIEPGSEVEQILFWDIIDSDRIDYDVTASSLFDDGSEFSSTLSYVNKEKNDYEIAIDSPSIELVVYWRGEEQESVVLNFPSCDVFDTNGDQVDHQIRISVVYDEDMTVGGMWNAFGLRMNSKYRNTALHYKFAPHAQRKTDYQPTKLTVFYPLKFNGILTGDFCWKYGLSSKQMRLREDGILFHEDIAAVERKIESVTEYPTGNIFFSSFYDDQNSGGVYFDTEKLFHPSIVFHQRKTKIKEVFKCHTKRK